LRPLDIAVIGSGISGLSAAWLLSQKHHVTLFEVDSRLGGHAHTVDVRLKDGAIQPIDTGFIVSNPTTYPNFMAFMDYLDVEMFDTTMSFSVSSYDTGFEYCGSGLGALLGPKKQWLWPRQWRLVADLVRFYKTVERHAETLDADMTLGAYLDRFHYSRHFSERHILPIGGAIWSSGHSAMASFPLRAFVRFFANHQLFDLGDRPNWRTVKGGARTYVERLVQDGKFRSVLGEPVVRIARTFFGVDVVGQGGALGNFDHAVIATHADQALRLLEEPTADERRLLPLFKTSRNRAILHRDHSLMPRSRQFWSAWNYHVSDRPRDDVAVTYWMNALQSLESPGEHFVSLNPLRDPAPHLVDRELVYRHPVFTPAAMAGQSELWDLQGKNRTWFAGAWFGAGFHEDGLQAGLAVAEQLGGVRRPWTVADESGRIHVKPVAHPLEPVLVQAAE
jgi:uncharacterized protein